MIIFLIIGLIMSIMLCVFCAFFALAIMVDMSSKEPTKEEWKMR